LRIHNKSRQQRHFVAGCANVRRCLRCYVTPAFRSRILILAMLFLANTAKAEEIQGVCSISVYADQVYELNHQFKYDTNKPNFSQEFLFQIPGMPYKCLHKVHDLESGSWLRCNHKGDWWLSDRTSFEEDPKQDMRVQHKGNFFAVKAACIASEDE